MNILVLNPPFLKRYSRPQRSPAVTKSGTLYYPIWLASCAGVLEREGYHVSLVDAPARDLSLAQTMAMAKAFSPNMAVLDTSTPSIENDIQVASLLKEILPECFVVLVGTHVSALPEETLALSPSLDAVARGEYEYTIRQLARVLSASARQEPGFAELNEIEGLSYRHDGCILHNSDRPFIENLDDLPWVSTVYKKHLNIHDYFNPNALYPMITLITSRGCPFRCDFCVYPQTLTGRRYRFRSIEDILNEIGFIIQQFPWVKAIFFEDDTLTANKRRCMELAEGMQRREYHISWTANSRVEVDLETLQMMKAAGCRELCVGFESGEQLLLDNMKKGIKLHRMFQFMEDARKAGILIHGCFMMGFPGDSLESIAKTIDLAIRLKPDTAQFYPVMVYPGTEAYNKYLQRGWITAQNFGQWLTRDGFHSCVVRNDVLEPADLVRLCDVARRKFYLRPQYLVYKALQAATKPADLFRTLKTFRTFMKPLLQGSKV